MRQKILPAFAGRQQLYSIVYHRKKVNLGKL
jgi:hypothetical protein